MALGTTSGMNLTSFSGLLKTLYPREVIEDQVYKNRPLLALLDKNENFRGNNLQVPLIYANPQGTGASFSVAQGRSTASTTQTADWLLTRASRYTVVTIDSETMEASEEWDGAFLEARQVEIDGGLNGHANQLETLLFGDGTGRLGQIGSVAANSQSLTLSNPDDIVNFEIGMPLVAASGFTAGTAVRAAGSSGNPLFVTSVNRSNGTVGFGFAINDATNGLVSPAINDYLFINGDQTLAGTIGTTNVMQGLLSYLTGWNGYPTQSFFNVARGADTTRLGGQFFDATLQGTPLDEALQKLASLIYREGGTPDICFLSPAQYNNLVVLLGSKVTYMRATAEAGTEGTIGFDGVKVIGPAGPITVLPAPKCQDAYAFMLEMDTWTLHTLGSAPKILEPDGLSAIRQSSNDGIEVRIASRGNLVTRAPGFNGVARLQ